MITKKTRKKKLVPAEDLDFGGSASELTLRGMKEERDLAGELLNRNFQKDTLDAFESKLFPKPKVKKPTLKMHNKMLRMSYADSRDLLNELMNNPKYGIVYFKDNFGVDGEYYVFVVYSENLDIKDKKPSTDEDDE